MTPREKFEKALKNKKADLMELRDQFAMAALNAMVVHEQQYHPATFCDEILEEQILHRAHLAFKYADAMLEARKVNNGSST